MTRAAPFTQKTVERVLRASRKAGQPVRMIVDGAKLVIETVDNDNDGGFHGDPFLEGLKNAKKARG